MYISRSKWLLFSRFLFLIAVGRINPDQFLATTSLAVSPASRRRVGRNVHGRLALLCPKPTAVNSVVVRLRARYDMVNREKFVARGVAILFTAVLQLRSIRAAGSSTEFKTVERSSSVVHGDR